MARCHFLLEKANSNRFRFLFSLSKSETLAGIFNLVENFPKSYKTHKLLNINNKHYIANFDKSVSGATDSPLKLGHFARNLSNHLRSQHQKQPITKMPRYEIVEKGTTNSKNYRIYFSKFSGCLRHGHLTAISIDSFSKHFLFCYIAEK